MKEILSEIIEISDIRPSVNHSPNYEKIKWNELKEMSTERLFTIGGHSMYHDILTSFSNLEKLEEDIKLSIDLLKYNLNIPIRHYAYPEGQINHYNNEVINILKKNNIICSPSAINGTNTLETDLFNLKRVRGWL
jgi:peptidoglycan/xylan/chitin deacetylase (PgdA/CDA1 family)